MTQKTWRHSYYETNRNKFRDILHSRKQVDVGRYGSLCRIAAEDQYASFRTALSKTLQHQTWEVDQVSFITVARSLNEEDLRKNLQVFEVPQAGIETIRSKLVMTLYNEYVLKGMYSARFNGGGA